MSTTTKKTEIKTEKTTLFLTSEPLSVGTAGFLPGRRTRSFRPSVVARLAQAAFLALPACVGLAQTAPTAFVVSEVSFFDGERMRPPTNVVVEGGLIRAVDDQVPDQWRDLPVIAAAGATLLPGLIDAHTHTAADTQLQEALRFGVTTVLDMKTTRERARTLREAATTRRDVADFRFAGFAVAPGGHASGGDTPTVSGPDDAEAFVEARKSEGADYLKIMLNGVRTARDGIPNLDAATARALVQAGHSRGMLVVAHVEDLADVRVAVASGVDGLVHAWREGGYAPEVAKLVAEHDVFVVPTMAAPDGSVRGTGATLAADPRLKPFLSVAMVQRLTRETSRLRVNIEPYFAAVRSLVAAGVVLVAGSDVPNFTTVHGASLHRELELLVQEAGLTPVQALAAATKNAADAFQLSDRGRIEVGARADLLLVRSDPSKDITTTRDILKIWRSGFEVDRKIRQPWEATRKGSPYRRRRRAP